MLSMPSLPTDPIKRKTIKRRLGCYRSLIPFTRVTHPAYKPAPFHRDIATALEGVESGRIKRLMIFMPPRHGKSELASIRFPAWYLGRNPTKDIITCSYAVDLARDFAYKARNLVNSPTYQDIFQTRLQGDQRAAHRWMTEQGGGLLAAGVGGPITGRGANVLLIDDPVKNWEESQSETIREKIWSWYTSTAYTRLMPQGAIVLIMTRWHQDDLAGRLLDAERKNHGNDKWDIVKFPAINDDGSALWPEAFNLDDLRRIREVQGPQGWNSLYMQSPKPGEGSILKSDQIVLDVDLDNLPEFDRIVIAWDTAFEKHSQADYSVGTVWGQTKTGYHLLDVARGRWTFPTLKKRVIALYDKWTNTTKDDDGKVIDVRSPDSVIVEQAASGRDIIHELRANTSLPIVAVKVKNDKIARANGVSGRFEAGRVHAPARAPWLADLFNELDYFPNGAHDDQVDSVVHAIRYMTRTSGSVLA